MKTVVLTLVACLLTAACGSDPGVELDAHGLPVRQCAAMQGVYRVVVYKPTGSSTGCPVGWNDTGLGFGTYAKPGEIMYTADGCGVAARIEWKGSVYAYDLSVEPDGSAAHGTGTLSYGEQCRVSFRADVSPL